MKKEDQMVRRTLQTMTAVAALGLAACASQPEPATL
jgi:predicted outer membrane protein